MSAYGLLRSIISSCTSFNIGRTISRHLARVSSSQTLWTIVHARTSSHTLSVMYSLYLDYAKHPFWDYFPDMGHIDAEQRHLDR